MEMKRSSCKKVSRKHGTDGTNATDGTEGVNETRLAGSLENTVTNLPSDVAASLGRACKAGKWLIAIFHVEQENLILDRTAMNFPVADLELASRLFVENVQRLKS
jgi:hypothetical protein